MLHISNPHGIPRVSSRYYSFSLPTGFSTCLCSHLSQFLELTLLSPAPMDRVCCLPSLCPRLPSLSPCLPLPWSLRSSPLQKWPSFPFSKIKIKVSLFPPCDSWHIFLFPLDNLTIPFQCVSWVPFCAQLLNVWLSRDQSWTLFLHLSLPWEVFLPDVTQQYLPY